MSGYISKDEVEIAFLKYQAHVYFDKNDLHSRNKLSEWINKNKDLTTAFNEISKFLNEDINNSQETSKLLSRYTDQIKLTVLPKKIEPKNNDAVETTNFYTNENLINNSEIKSIQAFIDIPVELHIINILWIMKYGVLIDARLLSLNYGNRLFLNENEQLSSKRSLFKPYQIQYQNWWNKAVKETEALLKEDQDATILNFDFKSFFHSVQINFNDLTRYISNIQNDLSLTSISNDILHKTLIQTHEKYTELVEKQLPGFIVKAGEATYPLPIGLLSSHIIANWHLEKFDNKILEELNPIYYGRYVDDILIVLKDRIIKREELKKKKNNGKISITKLFFDTYLKKIFEYNSPTDRSQEETALFKGTKDTNDNTLGNETTDIEIKVVREVIGYNSLELQSEKVHIYQFNHKMSPNLLSKFVKEQEKSGYIFQFLSDEVDDMFNEFEVDAFEDSLEDVDLNKSRFKQQEINRFRFAVFMAKLIKRRILNGDNYKKEEVEKISKYFKGIYTLKSYLFWEKLFTLYIVSNERNKFWHLLNTIVSEIEKLDISVKIPESQSIVITIKDDLKKHLKYSLQMALGLCPDYMLDGKSYEFISKSSNHKTLLDILSPNIISEINLEEYRKLIVHFRQSGLLRSSYIYYPLVQFTQTARDNYVPLYKPEFFKFLDKNYNFDIKKQAFYPIG